jgi:hypothetical protein
MNYADTFIMKSAARFNKNAGLLTAKCREVKENDRGLFETLCQKMYNEA